MKTLGKDEKPIVGKLLNEVRTAVTAALEQAAEKFRGAKESEALSKIDISLPGTPHERGQDHARTVAGREAARRRSEIFRPP